MQRIPDSTLLACLAVLYSACVRARSLGYEGQTSGLGRDRAELLADLMDAVHNLPDLIVRWSECDESLVRANLEDFDARWPSEGIGLLATYNHSLAGATP